MRRTTRVVRSTRDSENASNARTRVSTRTKSTGTSTAASTTRGMTSSTTASKAKMVSKEVTTKDATGTKRKREALSEVTTLVTNNTTKGKEGENVAGAGIVTKTKTMTKFSISKAGQVQFGTAATRRERLVRAASEVTTVSTKADIESISTLESEKGPSCSQTHEHGDTKMDVDVPLLSVEEEMVDDGVEAQRIFKKRYEDVKPVADSSQVDADKVAAELHPDPQLWDDLDADDWDDPLMVSEYVVDVCKYLKEIEVG